MMRRLLITGGSGFLGAHLLRAAVGWEVLATYHTRPITPPAGRAVPLDLREGAAVAAALQELRPDVVIHTACSNRNAEHIAAIAPAARHLATAARAQGFRLIHVSTDLVFDGEHAPYHDDSPVAPLGAYGQAKAEAERLLAEVCPEAVIIRPSLIWGLGPVDHQTGWLLEGARSGRAITLFTDERRCPVYVHDLAAGLLELAERPEVRGVMNMGGPQALSRWDFGQRLLEALGVGPAPNVTPGTVLGSGLVRARDLTMVSARAAHELRTRLQSVDEVLAAGGAWAGR